MRIFNSISRLSEYCKRHGLSATIRRTRLALTRAFFANRKLVFYCDLKNWAPLRVIIPSGFSVRNISMLTALSATSLQEMTDFWNAKLALQSIRERFEKGASLWLIECGNRLAGYGWTIRGQTIAPYYFPLAHEDVHFFDFHVFPQFRGQGINPCLVSRILDDLAKESAGRAFIEVAEWNYAQLSSLEKTSFRYLGEVRSFVILDQIFVSWIKSDTIAQRREEARLRRRILARLRSNE